MYHLNLSIIYKIYSIFHVVFLKLYNCRLNNDFILKYFTFKLIDDEFFFFFKFYVLMQFKTMKHDATYLNSSIEA